MTSLLELALSADSHVLILGSSGAGKTTLIREMLSVFTSDDYVVLVFDPAQLYENYCDIHAPLPVSLLEVRDKLVDILCEALSTRYRTDRYTLSPLMEELLHRVLTSPTVTSLRDVVEELDFIHGLINMYSFHEVNKKYGAWLWDKVLDEEVLI